VRLKKVSKERSTEEKRERGKKKRSRTEGKK
jgi:hypothetical protein